MNRFVFETSKQVKKKIIHNMFEGVSSPLKVPTETRQQTKDERGKINACRQVGGHLTVPEGRL